MTDPAVADRPAIDRRSRRALLGAGVLGAAAALTGSRIASAATPTGVPEADRELLRFAIGVELAARDLYDAAGEAGATGSVWHAMREQHESYAQLMAGIAGTSSDERNDAVYDEFVGAFTSTTSEAAYTLENVAAATHIELLAAFEDPDAAAASASIAAIESRHAAVLAGVAGLDDDLDAVFFNTADPLAPEA